MTQAGSPLPPPRSRAEDDAIRRVIAGMKTIAVVGLSADPGRASYRVANFLQARGFEIFPVNPALDAVLGKPSYPSISALPIRIDVIDVFRRSQAVPEIAEQAVEHGATALWLQEGVIHESAAQRAQDAGLDVVMDRCMLKEVLRLETEIQR